MLLLFVKNFDKNRGDLVEKLAVLKVFDKKRVDLVENLDESLVGVIKGRLHCLPHMTDIPLCTDQAGDTLFSDPAFQFVDRNLHEPLDLLLKNIPDNPGVLGFHEEQYILSYF